MNTYLPSVWSSIGPEVFDRQIDRLFSEALQEIGMTGHDCVPPCNVWEDEQGFYVQLAVPGWEAKELTLDVNQKILTIKGERAAAEEAGHFHLHEIAGTKFFRIFTLPAFVDHEKAKAVHANGLLTISFPKREEAKARRILIEAA
jgi:HSP20 family protein